MAEGILRHLAGDRYEVFSAGTDPSGLNRRAVEIMSEIGIDISAHRSKPLTEFAGQPFDVVITVCDRARESCPVFPGGARTLHWSFDDPAAATGSEAERCVVFRRVREEIVSAIRGFLS
jgi:arsenate reductase